MKVLRVKSFNGYQNVIGKRYLGLWLCTFHIAYNSYFLMTFISVILLSLNNHNLSTTRLLNLRILITQFMKSIL